VEVVLQDTLAMATCAQTSMNVILTMEVVLKTLESLASTLQDRGTADHALQVTKEMELPAITLESVTETMVDVTHTQYAQKFQILKAGFVNVSLVTKATVSECLAAFRHKEDAHLTLVSMATALPLDWDTSAVVSQDGEEPIVMKI